MAELIRNIDQKELFPEENGPDQQPYWFIKAKNEFKTKIEFSHK